MRKYRHIPLLFAIFLVCASCQQKEDVDIILRNTKIYTVNNSFAVMQSAAIRDGKFVAISNDANIFARYTSDSILDLKGKYVYPGFIDTHMHFMQYALSLGQIDLSGADSISVVVNLLTNGKSGSANRWIVARNLSESLVKDGSLSDNELINRVFPNTPVFIWIDGYNTALVNKAFLRKSKFKTDSPNGFLSPDESKSAYALIPEPSEEQIAELLQMAEKNCFNVGITSVTDYGTSFENAQLIDRLQQDGILQMPVYAILEPSSDNVDNYISKVPYYTDRLKVLAVGVDLDGRLCQKRSVMLQPYSAGKTNGTMKISSDSLLNICQMAYDNGFQVCIGCTGDSAVRVALNTFANVIPPKNNLRWRLENMQMVSQKDLRKIGHFSIMPSILPQQYYQNRDSVSVFFQKKANKEAFAWKQLVEQNQGVVCGSNAPYGKLDAVAVYKASVRQKEGKVNNKQNYGLTPAQALKSITIWAAYSQFDEKQKGSIAVGKWADFVVASENIMTMSQAGLEKNVIERTYLHGKRVK